MTPHTPPGLIRPHQSRLALLHRLFDGLCIMASLWLCTLLYHKAWSDRYALPAVIATLTFYFLAEHYDLYRSWRGASIRLEIHRLIVAWLWSVIVLVLLAFISKQSAEYSRRIILTWVVTTPVFLGLWRIGIRQALRALRARGHNSRTAVIMGAGDLGTRVARIFLRQPWMGIRLIGFYDDAVLKGARPLSGEMIEVRGSLPDLVQDARKGGIDLVYIALPMRAEAAMRYLATELADTTASVYIVPDFFIFDLLHSRWLSLGGITVVSIYENPFDGLNGWVKRVGDVIFASAVLTLTALPMAIIALGVKLSSPGPVIFRQRRYGLNGEVVEVWKFRTMMVCEDGDCVKQACRQDPRVTPFGAFLRRTSLDELPQFFNVIQGHMSIVGPRPHAVAHNEQYRRLIQGYMLRHKVKPGITGLAQINGWRGETDVLEKMERRVAYDLEYIRIWSLLLDLRIMAKTLYVGFWRRNAY